MRQTRFGSHVYKRAVAIIFEKMRCGLLARGKAFETRTIHQENVEPTVVVIVVEGDTTASRFQQILVLVFAAENSFHAQAGVPGHIDKAHAEIRGLFLAGLFGRAEESSQPTWERKRQDSFQ